jgi:hypothetical protein
MRSLFLILLLTFTCLSLEAQTLKGKVYDSISTIRNIKVFNETQNRVTATNDDGEFNIIAKVNDTILFESLFYHPKAVVLKPYHFDDVAVFELKKIVSELDEVEVINKKQAKFDSLSYYSTISKEQTKLAKTPLVQSGDNLMPTLDLKMLSKSIAKLFKSKRPEVTFISVDQLLQLFKTDDFFNETLLREHLKIPKKQKYPFIEFCAAKQLNSELLKDENKMQFLEELVLNSQLFLILLERYGEEKVIKD